MPRPHTTEAAERILALTVKDGIPAFAFPLTAENIAHVRLRIEAAERDCWLAEEKAMGVYGETLRYHEESAARSLARAKLWTLQLETAMAAQSEAA